MQQIKKPQMRAAIITVLFLLGGAVLGYLYYRIWGCNGTCAITSSPYRSSIYGAIIGVLLRYGFKKEASSKQDALSNKITT